MEKNHDWKIFTTKAKYAPLRARMCLECGAMQTETRYMESRECWNNVTKKEFDERLEEINNINIRYDRNEKEYKQRLLQIEKDRLENLAHIKSLRSN